MFIKLLSHPSRSIDKWSTLTGCKSRVNREKIFTSLEFLHKIVFIFKTLSSEYSFQLIIKNW